MKASEIQKRVHTYEEPEIYSDSVTDEILEKLSAEDLCSLAAGTGMAAQGRKFLRRPEPRALLQENSWRRGLPKVCPGGRTRRAADPETSAVTIERKTKAGGTQYFRL